MDKFISGLNSMIARDIRIAMDLTRTKYAQVVERVFTAEIVEDQIN